MAMLPVAGPRVVKSDGGSTRRAAEQLSLQQVAGELGLAHVLRGVPHGDEQHIMDRDFSASRMHARCLHVRSGQALQSGFQFGFKGLPARADGLD